MPLMISRLSVSRDSWLMTSLSAKTVQVELMDTFLVDCAPSVPRSSTFTSSTRAITSRNRPVPAAHLSFMTKLVMTPFSIWSTFTSWPPMSMTVWTSGKRKLAPLAWQLSSLICWSAISSMELRP